MATPVVATSPSGFHHASRRADAPSLVPRSNGVGLLRQHHEPRRGRRRVRSPSGWTRRDSLVVLASYAARPPHLALPPRPELERVASVLRMPVEAVRVRMLRFAGHDAANPVASDQTLGLRDRRLWEEYWGDPMRLQADAEWAVEEGKYRPRWLYKDEGSGP